MRIIKSAFPSPFLAKSMLKCRQLKCRQTSRAFPLALVPLLVILHGCAGAVTSNSNTGAFNVTGAISPAADGNGATIALSGPTSLSTTGSSSGTYSFSGLNNGIYTVTPSRSGYIFSPTVNSFTIDGGNISGINFTAAQASTHSVKLAWNASTSTVTGYNVYRGTSNGGPYTKMNSAVVTALNYADSSLASSTTYYYVTTAIDAAGVESAYSNQATAVVP